MLDLGFESFQLLFHGADFVRKLFSPPATQRQDKNSSGHVKLTEESNQAGQTMALSQNETHAARRGMSGNCASISARRALCLRKEA